MDETKSATYQSAEILEYYKSHRNSWEGLYPSEKKIIEEIQDLDSSKVLDMGCACGGLARALRERFNTQNYTGVEINRECVRLASELHPWAKFHSGDFLDVYNSLDSDYDVVFSLSCADWNINTKELFTALFSKLKVGGKMVFSCRLAADLPAHNDSYLARQEILFSDPVEDIRSDNETAPYRIFTLSGILKLLQGIGNVDAIRGYGYWGPIPKTVISPPVNRLHYTVFSIQKSKVDAVPRIILDLDSDFLIQGSPQNA